MEFPREISLLRLLGLGCTHRWQLKETHLMQQGYVGPSQTSLCVGPMTGLPRSRKSHVGASENIRI